MYYMPTISVRISEEEKRKLMKYGPLSKSVRDALRIYLDAKRTEQFLSRLGGLQSKNPIKTTTEEEVRMIMEGRRR